MILLTPIQNYNLINVFLFFPLQKYPVAVIEHNLIILLKMPRPLLPFFEKQTPNLTQQNW